MRKTFSFLVVATLFTLAGCRTNLGISESGITNYGGETVIRNADGSFAVSGGGGGRLSAYGSYRSGYGRGWHGSRSAAVLSNCR